MTSRAVLLYYNIYSLSNVGIFVPSDYYIRVDNEQVSISSTFYVQIFCADVVLAAFSSYVLALAKNSYKKCARIMLMKWTTDGPTKSKPSSIVFILLFCVKNHLINDFEYSFKS